MSPSEETTLLGIEAHEDIDPSDASTDDLRALAAPVQSDTESRNVDQSVNAEGGDRTSQIVSQIGGRWWRHWMVPLLILGLMG
jgi:hypothetical protein